MWVRLVMETANPKGPVGSPPENPRAGVEDVRRIPLPGWALGAPGAMVSRGLLIRGKYPMHEETLAARSGEAADDARCAHPTAWFQVSSLLLSAISIALRVLLIPKVQVTRAVTR